MYDVYHGIVPDIFEGMFVYNNMIHYRDTRKFLVIYILQQFPQIYPKTA